MKFVFVCQGDAEDFSERPDLGHNDPPLTPLGRRQAVSVASVLAREVELSGPFTGLYASPIGGAQETASIISEQLELPLSGIMREFATLTPEWLPERGSVAYGEALEALREQAWSGVELLREALPDDASVIVVSHPLTIRALVSRGLEMDPDNFDTLSVLPGSLTSLEYRRQRYILNSLNNTAHLAAT